MSPGPFTYVYGPVPSRRLGRSLGVDPVPFKTCTLDCVYCQLGRTTNKTIARREYAPVEAILAELDRKLSLRPALDFISLAGSGEPTLNSRLGELIRGIKRLTRVPVAVLTNGSLLWMPQVRDDLKRVDLVLPSLDAGDARLYRYVNRPHPKLDFGKVVRGLTEFTAGFPGRVWLEVFLLAGVTGLPVEVKKIAALARRIGPARVQLNTVSRPPAEEFACPLEEEELARLARLFPGPVEVIRENQSSPLPARKSPGTDNEEMLALLDRRPCTVHDVCLALGLNPGEATKRLVALANRGLIRTVRRHRAVFFEAARPG
jgi:wyosine [tRNA(Phe)-imidazoG37] synthetase (radical SAM superfamily)